MTAGRDLDALVAEKVMGWVRGKIGPADDLSPVWFPQGPDSYWTETVPRFSTDIADAWQVVEKLRQTHCCLNLHSDHAYAYSCSLIKNDDDPHEPHSGIGRTAETAPLAICLTALLSVGVDLTYEERETNP